jgi:hypothetical protein
MLNELLTKMIETACLTMRLTVSASEFKPTPEALAQVERLFLLGALQAAGARAALDAGKGLYNVTGRSGVQFGEHRRND